MQTACIELAGNQGRHGPKCRSQGSCTELLERLGRGCPLTMCLAISLPAGTQVADAVTADRQFTDAETAGRQADRLHML